MDFIKFLNRKNMNKCAFATLVDGNLLIRIPRNVVIKKIGLIDGGIGVVCEEGKREKKARLTQIHRQLSAGDAPTNLLSTGYKFKIRGEQVSDTGYIFMYSKAEMIKPKTR